MNYRKSHFKTWLFAIGVLGLTAGVAAALPNEASASQKSVGKSAVHAKTPAPGWSAKKGIPVGRIGNKGTHRPAFEKKYDRNPPSKTIIHCRPPARSASVHRVRPRSPWPIFAASFSYQLITAPVYSTSAPTYVVAGTGVPPTRSTVAYRISVTADLLNVRSGPGLNKPVVCTVRSGDILNVRAASDGWLYVTLSDGRPGWLMEYYTRRM
ncbi:MAG TPA: SH3 domain-containing protein [Desulfobacteraceae bacterium]|nr:SH3 domain-containing protein [Desulfobacteraceae bacterium]